jgi:hypothetical protein
MVTTHLSIIGEEAWREKRCCRQPRFTKRGTLVAWDYGIPIRRVSVIPDQETGRLGGVLLGVREQMLLAKASEGWPLTRAERGYVEDCLVCRAAGGEAERRFTAGGTATVAPALIARGSQRPR